MCHFYETIVNGYFQYHSEADHTKQIGFYNNGRPIRFTGNQSSNGTCNIFFKHTIKEARKSKQKSRTTAFNLSNEKKREKKIKKQHRSLLNSRLMIGNETICNNKHVVPNNQSSNHQQKRWLPSLNQYNFLINANKTSLLKNSTESTQTVNLKKNLKLNKTEIVDLHHSLNNICSINCSTKADSIKKIKKHRHRHGKRIVLQ